MRSKMMKTIAQLVLFLGWVCFGSTRFCDKIGSYDFACRFDGNFLIISSFPCHSAGKVAVTLIDEQTMEVKSRVETFKDITIKSVNSATSIVLLLANHTDGPHVGNLHVMGFSYSEVTQKTKILDVYFFLEFAAECKKMFTGASHVYPHACKASLRTGDFSVLCITNKGVIDPSLEGAALVALDPCTHPFSVVSLLFAQMQSGELLKSYTGNKTDEFVAIKTGSKSGMKLTINYYGDGLKLNALLKFGSSDQDAVELVNDYFFPDDSLMCTYSDCILVTPADQHCRSRIITGDKIVKDLNTTISVDPCKPLDTARIIMRLEGHNNSIEANLKLEPLNEEEEKLGVTDLLFTMKTTGKVKEGSGFVPEEGGLVSLAVLRVHDIEEYGPKEDPSDIVVIVNRHYPTPEYAFPLLRTEFSRSYAGCPSRGKRQEKRTLVKAIVGVFLFLFIVVVVVLALLWWRRKQKQRDGLPYQMELDSDDAEDAKI